MTLLIYSHNPVFNPGSATDEPSQITFRRDCSDKPYIGSIKKIA